MKIQKKKSAFTLVELIIVITILSILATIGFISFQSYMSSARDTSRISSIKNIQDGLELYSLVSVKYPNPDNPVTLTGGNTSILQGILGKTVGDNIKLTSEVKDPQTNNYYTYSISNNGIYYQIRADLENTTAYNGLIETTYAEGTKALVKGNYKFDPSLPSLITVSGSVNSASGIFDPNVCFVINNGSNLVTSNSTNCIKKKDTSLKDFDSSLVGYWDMEGNGCPIDSSGNNINPFSCAGTSLTGGLIGGARKLSNATNAALRFSSRNFSNTFSTGTNFTLMFNYRLDGFVGIGTSSVFHLGPTSSLTTSISYAINGGKQLIRILDGANYIYGPDINTNNFGEWKQITISYNGENYNFYNNGILVYSYKGGSITLGSPVDLTFPFFKVGMSVNKGDITIDELSIYNRALSDSEIVQKAKIIGLH